MEGLIGRLGSPRFREREEATRKLLQLEESAPELRVAMRSADPEVSHRSARILQGLERRPLLRTLGRGERGEIDLLIDGLFVNWRGTPDDAFIWHMVTVSARRLVDGVGGKQPEVGLIPGRGFWEMPETPRSHFVLPGRLAYEGNKHGGVFDAYCRAPAVSVRTYIGTSVVLAEGDVEARDGAGTSIIFANGNVRLGGKGLGRSLILCDGDVEVNAVNHSIVIARGNIRFPWNGRSIHSHLIAGGTVSPHSKDKQTTVKQKLRDDFGFVAFFDPAEAGVEVAQSQRGIRIEKVHPGKPFAKSGFQPGDVILAVDGRPVDSTDSFRRLLRRGVVRERATFQVHRGERITDVAVLFDRVPECTVKEAPADELPPPRVVGP